MATEQQGGSLQSLIDSKPNLTDYFYNETLAPHFRARTGLTAAFIPPEFTNWRDEQTAWRETAILFDQSHHMPELFIKGPGALPLLTKIGINSLANFGPNRAKQLVGCSPSGHVIGDCVLYWRGEDDFELVSGMALLNWVHYNAEAGGYDVTISRDDPTPYNPTGRRVFYRYQLDGPNAEKIWNEVCEGGAPNVPFFQTTTVRIKGHEVMVLRHGMAGHRGVEISGPYEEGPAVRQAIIDAGEKYGLKLGGTKSYFSTLLESAWMAYPLPAIYTGEDMRGFREWLPANGWEANAQLGGSFVSDNIEDYYVTPYDIGYERIIKFDHDFIGREALEAIANAAPRKRVTLEWNVDDVMKVIGSQFTPGTRYKAFEFPVAYYGFPHFDTVRDTSGKHVGFSNHCGYTNNESAFLSLASIDVSHAEPGTEVVLTWGEPNGGSRKPHVERHEQVEVRATVAPAPYSAAVQRMKRETVHAGV